MVLDKLISAVTLLFVLSLSTERVAELFKRRNWTGRFLWPGNWLPPRGNWISVDLRTGAVIEKRGRQDVSPVVDPEQRRRHLKAANASTTFLVGVLLAGLTGADALGPLLGDVWWKATGPGDVMVLGVAKAVMPWLCVVATGAAAGIGSSFWHDLLGMLIEVRRLRSSLADGGEGARQGTPLVLPDPKRRAEALQRIARFRAAETKAAELRQTLGAAMVVRDERADPGVRIEVQKAGAPDAVEVVTDAGEKLMIPVRTRAT